jgi:hypothetical protein
VLISTALILKCRVDWQAAKDDEKFMHQQQANVLDPSHSMSHASDFSSIAPTDREGRSLIAMPATVKKPPEVQPPLKMKKTASRSTGAHTTFPVRSAQQRSAPSAVSDSRLNPFWGAAGAMSGTFAGDSASQGTGASDSLFATPKQPAGSLAPTTPPTESPGQYHNGAAIVAGRSSSSECSELTSVLSDSSVVSRSLSKVKISGNARRANSAGSGPTLPSASNNYPHSEELSKMSSREIHRRMRSPDVSGRRSSTHKTPALARIGRSASATAVGADPMPRARSFTTETEAPAGPAAEISNPVLPDDSSMDLPAVSGLQRSSADAEPAAAAVVSSSNQAGVSGASSAQHPSQARRGASNVVMVTAAETEAPACSSTGTPQEPSESAERPGAGYVAAAMAAAAAEPPPLAKEPSPPTTLPVQLAAADAGGGGSKMALEQAHRSEMTRGAPSPSTEASPPLDVPVTQHESGVIQEGDGMALQHFSTRRVRPDGGGGEQSSAGGAFPILGTSTQLPAPTVDAAGDAAGELSRGGPTGDLNAGGHTGNLTAGEPTGVLDGGAFTGNLSAGGPSGELTVGGDPTDHLTAGVSSVADATRGMHGSGDTTGLLGAGATADMMMGMTAADAAMAEGRDSPAISEKSQAMSISSFTSVSVFSESTSVFSNVGCAFASVCRVPAHAAAWP